MHVYISSEVIKSCNTNYWHFLYNLIFIEWGTFFSNSKENVHSYVKIFFSFSPARIQLLFLAIYIGCTNTIWKLIISFSCKTITISSELVTILLYIYCREKEPKIPAAEEPWSILCYCLANCQNPFCCVKTDSMTST